METSKKTSVRAGGWWIAAALLLALVGPAREAGAHYAALNATRTGPACAALPDNQILGCWLQAHPSVANFVLISFPERAGRRADAASAWLERRGILGRSMAAYGLPQSLRLSVGLEDDNRRAVAALLFSDARTSQGYRCKSHCRKLL